MSLFSLLPLLEISGLCLHSLQFKFAVHDLDFLRYFGNDVLAAEMNSFRRLFYFPKFLRDK